MALTRPAQVAATLVVASTLLAAGVWLQQVREARFPTPPDREARLYLTSGPMARRLALEYQTLSADLYWIRAIQHYGGTRRVLAAAAVPQGATPLPGFDYQLLYPLLDLTTTLDPRFGIAYHFGATFLAEPYPGGPGRPDQAIALLEKGLREQPDRWQYLRDIGFVSYWWVHDYRAAADAFGRAAKIPGAPWWLQSLAATTLAQGGDRRSSRLMWEAIREVAENDWLRRNAEHRLQQLTALDQLDTLQQLVDRYAARVPAGWDELVHVGVLRGTPIDPTGAPYLLTPDGRVRLSEASSLYPLPDEPIRIGGVS